MSIYEDIKRKISFDIYPEYDEINFNPDDFRIFIEIELRDDKKQKYMSPLSNPDELFNSLTKIINNKAFEINLGFEGFQPLLRYHPNDINSFHLIIFPPKYSYDIFLNIKNIDNIMYELFDNDEQKSSYNRWKSDERMNPTFSDVTIQLIPASDIFLIDKKDYYLAITNLFEKFTERVSLKNPTFKESPIYKKYKKIIEQINI